MFALNTNKPKTPSRHSLKAIHSTDFYMSYYIRPEILAMHGYVPGEQPREGSIIKLNTNENPYPSSPAVQRAIGRAIQAGLQKYPDPLATAFRDSRRRTSRRRTELDSVRQRQRRYLNHCHSRLRRPRRLLAAPLSQLHPLQNTRPTCRAPKPKKFTSKKIGPSAKISPSPHRD